MKEPKKMGRPLKIMTDKDWEKFEKLCYIQCTEAEIMGIFEIESKTLLIRLIKKHYGKQHTFATIYNQKSQEGKSSIRRRQYLKAMEGNPALLIWLGKQWLGQKDKQEVSFDEKHNLITLNYKLKEKDEKNNE